MRVTVQHHKTKAAAMQAVDRAVLDAFTGFANGPITITDQKTVWNGSVMTFSLVAKMGFMKNPIQGTVTVTDDDITIDADLGLFARLIPEEKLRTARVASESAPHVTCKVADRRGKRRSQSETELVR